MLEGEVLGVDLKGKVKWFNNTNGFGFLVGEGSDEDIFVHYSSIIEEGFKNLKEGQEVSYTLLKTPRGIQASEVKKL